MANTDRILFVLAMIWNDSLYVTIKDWKEAIRDKLMGERKG